MQPRTVSSIAAIAALIASAGCEVERKLIEIAPSLAVSSTQVSSSGTIGGSAVTSAVTIVNGTDGTLEGLTATIDYLGGPSGWLNGTLDKTTATREQAATLQLRTTPGSLGLGVYIAKVVLDADQAGNNGLAVEVRFTIEARPPAKIAILTQPSGQAANGGVFARQPVIQLLNAIDEPTPRAGVVITAALATGGGELIGSTTATTGADGRATFSGLGVIGLIGPRTLSFSAPAIASTASTAIDLTAGPALRIEAASPLTQTAAAGAAVANAPAVRIVDQSGNGVAGVAVAFTPSAGSVIAPASPFTTTATGTAGPVSWTLNPVAGTNTVAASSGTLEGSPIVFSATGQVGSATTLTKVSGDNLVGLVNTTLGTPHVVKVADAQGNGVAGVAIAWAVTGGGSVNPTTGTTDANGLAQTVRTLAAAPGSGTTTATATVNGGPLTVSFAVSGATDGPAAIAKITGDNQTGAVGATLGTALQVRVVNGVGAPVAGVSVSFTTPNPGGAFPGGAAVLTDAAGLATTTWRLGSVAGAQTAQAAVGGPAPVIFNATAASGPFSATLSTVAVNPATLTAGAGTSTITVTIRDASGNPITNQPVVLAVTGAATLTQPAAPTNASGQAVGTLAATIAGPKVVQASVGAVPVTQTATITVVAGAPTQIVALTTTSPTLRFGQSIAPSVQVRDAFGNGVPGVQVNFGVTLGQSTVNPLSVTTNSAGTAALGSWAIAAFASTASSPFNVNNRVVASAVPAGITGNPITFAGTVQVSFASDLYPFFNTVSTPTRATGGCTGAGCHTGGQNPRFDLTPAAVYAQLLAGTPFLPATRYVVPSDSINSTTTQNLLFRKSAGTAHTGGTFPANRVTIIKAWVQQGAPNN